MFRKIAKGTLYRTAETKLISTGILTGTDVFYGATGFRAFVIPMNTGTWFDGTVENPLGPSVGAGVSERVGNRIYSKGCKLHMYMQTQIQPMRSVLPVRRLYLYFRGERWGNQGATPSADMNNTFSQLSLFNRVDPKECVVLQDRQMLFSRVDISPVSGNNGTHMLQYYRNEYFRFKYQKLFKYQSTSDWWVNDGCYVLAFVFPYVAEADENNLTYSFTWSMAYKDV